MALSPDQKVFADWLAAPSEMRVPTTQKELAALLDVCPDTLSRWKKDPDLQAQVYQVAFSRLEAAIPDIMQVIIDNALAGRFQYVRLVLEMTQKYSSNLTIETSPPKAGIEAYAALIRVIENWEQGRAARRDGR